MLSRSMFRGAITKLSLRKRLMILVSVGVLLPLLVLTYMQYQSLARLENRTKGAYKDNLRQGLINVEHEMKQRLEEVAAQTLNPIGRIDLSASGGAAEFEKYSAEIKRSHPEIAEVFAFVNWSAKQDKNAYAYI